MICLESYIYLLNTSHRMAEKEGINPKHEIKELLEKTQISLWLDDYADIFSDFDPRPFSQRALSDDFLNEAKKVVRE